MINSYLLTMLLYVWLSLATGPCLYCSQEAWLRVKLFQNLSSALLGKYPRILTCLSLNTLHNRALGLLSLRNVFNFSSLGVIQLRKKWLFLSSHWGFDGSPLAPTCKVFKHRLSCLCSTSHHLVWEQTARHFLGWPLAFSAEEATHLDIWLDGGCTRACCN